MEKKELIITIAGTAASGKSRMTYLLKKFLKEQGFEVEQEYGPDHPNEKNFNKVMSNNFDSAIDVIRSTRKIVLKEAQLNRNYDK